MTITRIPEISAHWVENVHSLLVGHHFHRRIMLKSLPLEPLIYDALCRCTPYWVLTHSFHALHSIIQIKRSLIVFFVYSVHFIVSNLTVLKRCYLMRDWFQHCFRVRRNQQDSLKKLCSLAWIHSTVQYVFFLKSTMYVYVYNHNVPYSHVLNF